MSLALVAPLDEAIRRGDLVGGLALVAHGREITVATTGLQDLATGAPFRRDTIVRIASMTKPILAAVAMMLVEDGRIGLDGSVEPWLPELANRRVLARPDADLDDTVPADRPISLRDLLTLRFGLGLILGPPGPMPIRTALAELGLAPGPGRVAMDPDTYMARMGSLPLVHQPGTRWMYHTGSDVLAVLVARVIGRPLGEILSERLFGPMGMRDTGFFVPPAAIGRLATAYGRDESGRTGVAFDVAGDGQYATPPAFPSELVSTADDYLAFARLILGSGPRSGLLSEASRREMLTDQITAEQKAASPFAPGFWDARGWGFGGAIVTGRDGSGAGIGSYGWSGGFGTHVLIDRADDLVVLCLTQQLMRGPEDAALMRDVIRHATQAAEHGA